MEKQDYSREILYRLQMEGTIDILSTKENRYLVGYRTEDNWFVPVNDLLMNAFKLPDKPDYQIRTDEITKSCIISTRCLLGEEEVSLRILYYIPSNKQYYHAFVTPEGLPYFEMTYLPKIFEHQVTAITGVSMEEGFIKVFSKIMTRLKSGPQLSCSVCLVKFSETGEMEIPKDNYILVFDSDLDFKDYLEDVFDDPTSLVYELNLRRL